MVFGRALNVYFIFFFLVFIFVSFAVFGKKYEWRVEMRSRNIE